MRYSMFLGRKKQYSENENDYSTKCNLQIQCNPWQIANVFQRSRTKISQFLWKHKRPQIVKAVMRNKKGAGGINLPNFRLSYKATVWSMKSVQYTQLQYEDRMVLAQNWKCRPMAQIESPVVNSCTHSNLIFDKGGKNIQWGKDSLFNKWRGKTG